MDSHNTIIYSLESVISSGSSDEIPDSFFEVTASDMRVLMSQLRDNVRSMDNAPLMTAKLRELEDAKKTLVQLQYKETLIRIQFPNRLVLQTVFKPINTIAEVKEFLKTFLTEEVAEFQLCKLIKCGICGCTWNKLGFFAVLTPPKTILQDDERLVELHCVPQALIHFGGDGEAVKAEYLGKLSTAAAADFLAAKLRLVLCVLNEIAVVYGFDCHCLSFRGRIEMRENDANNELCEPAEDQMEVTSSCDEPKKRIVGTFKVSSTVTTEKGSLPKWFKPAK